MTPDGALSSLSAFGQQQAQVVELRFSGGLSVEESLQLVPDDALEAVKTCEHTSARLRACWLCGSGALDEAEHTSIVLVLKIKRQLNQDKHAACLPRIFRRREICRNDLCFGWAL